MLDAGHRVVVTWVVEREREAAARGVRGAVDLRRVDVTKPEEVGALATGARRRRRDRGRSRTWSADTATGIRSTELDLDAWDRQFELNVVQPGRRAAERSWAGMAARGGGRVVAVSSRTAVRPFAGAGAYAASKAAVIAAVPSASEEVKGAGVCVNCVLPSVIDTPANRSAMPDADHGRWVRPEEIGAVMRFLCSPEASAVTGAAIPVYGRS